MIGDEVLAMKEIKIGLIGLGFIGKLHAQAYRTIPYAFNPPIVIPKLVAVLRLHTGGSAEFIHSLGSPLVTTDPDEFFAVLSSASNSPAVVDICTPNHTHLPYAREALQRGLPVYCEKPLARSLAEAQEMADAAQAAGVPTHVAFMLRYLPAVRQIKALLEGGAPDLGTLWRRGTHRPGVASDRPAALLPGGGHLGEGRDAHFHQRSPGQSRSQRAATACAD
jgi:predicted dehydrogenase